MELTKEQRATLEKWLDSLLWKIGWPILSLSGVGSSLYLPTNTAVRISLLCSVVLLILVVKLYIRNLNLLRLRDSLQDEVESLKAPPWEPDDEARTVLCLIVDAYPKHFEPYEIRQSLENVLSDAMIEWALGLLVKNDYLKFDDGRGPVPGYEPYPENYSTTIKGRIYVESWRRERGL